MRFRLLGPVEVSGSDGALPLGGARQRAVLVALLLQPNRPVPVRQMAEVAWEEPPASARSNIRTYLAALRRLLGNDRLHTGPAGYRLVVAPEELDLLRFHALRTGGERALRGGDPAGAAEQLRAALALWRGTPFADIPWTTPLELDAARLDEQRLAAVEAYVQARLGTGAADDVVTDLRSLVLQHPLRERLWVLLMTALYRGGRQADALAAYAEARRALAEELGLEPGPELHRLQEQILRADPELDAEPATAAPVPVPAQLPPAVGDFTGRATEVARLREGPAGAGAASVWCVTGPAGVGKSSLAAHVAHLIRSAYPDGQLYLNLRGAETEPVPPAAALDQLLRALGVPRAGIPSTLDERIAAYRSRLADRRVLLVLDNAADEHQVRPLLPGTRAAAVLVTSRSALAGLEGTQVVPVGVLDRDEALRLLRRAVGDARVAAQPAGAAAIVDRCGRLPLALRVAAARLVGRPHWPLERLAARLGDERRRLDELRVGDLDVRASLALSYEGLSPGQQQGFRLLALLDAPDFPAWVAGPLLDVDLTTAEDLVEALVDARLVEVAGADVLEQPRFRLHDLLRGFGRDRAAAEDGHAPSGHLPLGRLLDAWLDLARRADALVPSQGTRIHPGPGPASRHVDALTAGLLADPVAWFDAEWPSLRAAVEQAAALGLDTHAWQLPVALATFCDMRSRFDDWDQLHGIGLAATERIGAPARRGEAILRQQLAVLRCRQNRFGPALESFQHARALFEAMGDVEGAAYGWQGVGWMHAWRGRAADALACLRRALVGFAETGNTHGLVGVLCGLGALARRAGDFDTAREELHRAWRLTKQRDNQVDEMSVVMELGRLHHAQGQLATAADFLELSLARALRWNDLDVASNVRLFLAETQLDAGATVEAERLIEQALEFFTRQHDPAGQAFGWRLLSRVHSAAGDADAAVGYARRALAASTDLDMPQERARALRDLAVAHWTADAAAAAEQCADEALRWSDAAGFAVEADGVRALLTAHAPAVAGG